MKFTKYSYKQVIAIVVLGLFTTSAAMAALVTDPNDPRSWQAATVGTFAQLFYGANNATTRQQVIDNQLLDDGLFDFTGSTGAAMISTVGVGSSGRSLDTDGTLADPYQYVTPSGDAATAGSSIDDLWVQTSGVIGNNVWDLGAPSTKAAIFNTIDHGPLPGEAIESTVYLSNDQITWIQAVTERVWLEGFVANTGVLWDGFTYAVGTGTGDTFRYASIIHGGPGALISDGDNEINGVLGLDADFTPVGAVPVPAAIWLFGTALIGFIGFSRRRNVA
jgi:hypothetical protein